jgi:hypothetical protein
MGTLVTAGHFTQACAVTGATGAAALLVFSAAKAGRLASSAAEPSKMCLRDINMADSSLIEPQSG